MSSLKNRILISFTVSLILFLLIFAVTIFFGFNLSLKDWNRANEEKLVENILKSLEKLYMKENPGKEDVETALSGYLKDNMEVTVFSPDGKIIFSHNRDKSDNQDFHDENLIRLLNRPMPPVNNMTGRGRMPFGGMNAPDRMNSLKEITPDSKNSNNSGPPYSGSMHSPPGPPPDVSNINRGNSTMPEMPFNSSRPLSPYQEGPDMYKDNNIPPPPPYSNTANRDAQGIRQFMKDRIDEAFKGQLLIRPVIADKQIKAFVKVKSLKFKFYSRVNRKFINSIIITVTTGTIAALFIALFSSWIISNKLARDAASLSDGLNRLAGGMRNVVFPDKGSEEILSIAESASILQQELIQDEERRKQWAQDIAHDLRTPITAVKAQIEAVKDGVFKPDTERFIKLLKELGRLETLVEDMNSLSKIEASENISEKDLTESSDIATILKERFDILAGEKNITLSFDTENFSFYCNLNLLIRALSNIVQNSIKYSSVNSDVKVVIKKAENNAVFKVKNPGHIENAEIERIFNRLYRGETGRTSEGSGLGLTIASAIIKQHRGTVKAENSEGNIIFTVSIPLSAV